VFVVAFLVRRVLPLAILLTVLPLLSPPPLWAGAGRPVLVLHSYQDAYRWTSAVNEGLRAGLPRPDWNLSFEYLDAKNVPPGFDFDVYAAVLAAKHPRVTWAAVVTVDDEAYEFFARHRASLFAGAPAVAIGLNGPPAQRLEGVSYRIENPDYARTVNLALSLQPQGGVVHVVLDQTLSGRRIRGALEALRYARPVRFHWIDQNSSAEVLEGSLAVPGPEPLIYGVHFDPALGTDSDDSLLRAISAGRHGPVFTFWTFHLDTGVVGGYLLDGQSVGAQGAEAVRDLVDRRQPASYRDDPLGRWTFDWPASVRHGLNLADLGAGVDWRHAPTEVWVSTWPALFAGLGVIAILGAFLVLISLNLRAKHRLVAQGNATIRTQRELMASLGDVIETRSEETASHVDRITRLAVLLADLAGLPEQRLEELRVCASMHDIGKVGIPDSILKNPGSLTPEERRIMETHTLIGHSIFRTSPNPMLQVAAVIAWEHHERWDGTGYPEGKSGQGIHILARIVAIVDVFDALLTDRVYKRAWDPDRVRRHLADESGRAFDPELLAVFLEHWDQFCDCREGRAPAPVPRPRKPRTFHRASAPKEVP